MKKSWVLSFVLLLGVIPAGFAPSMDGAASAAGVSTKQWLQISSEIKYYGEVSNGKPHGRGTMTWSENKKYSGDFVNGKRSGTGTYTNTYVDFETSQLNEVTYNGSWKNDKMNGEGTERIQVTDNDFDQTPLLNEIRKGTFKDNVLIKGYDVSHGLYDPDFNFVYKDSTKRLEIWSSNYRLVHTWKSGDLFKVMYNRGSSYYEYWAFPSDDAYEEKQRRVALMHLRTFTTEVTPHLNQFEYLSKLVPLR
ncbi:hypothetical protein [Saccharibacillus sacchari]|uniref:hypothetical protein n=1 Tax=Saccharibacillus sacchari TaxID=456493 RepID=UPI0004B02D12|nr:hypothetical protein [Saccharibacillus sacchari]